MQQLLFLVFFQQFIHICIIGKNYDVMSAKEKEAAAKQTFTFLAPLTNEQSCEAGRKSAIAWVREYRADKE